MSDFEAAIYLAKEGRIKIDWWDSDAKIAKKVI